MEGGSTIRGSMRRLGPRKSQTWTRGDAGDVGVRFVGRGDVEGGQGPEQRRNGSIVQRRVLTDVNS